MTFAEAIHKRLLMLDGAMGTVIQTYNLDEADFRGDIFIDHSVPLKGNNDVLTLTRPDVIRDIHRQYLLAGADIIETCSFNSQRISQHEYRLDDHITELNLAAARIAREEADRVMAEEPGRECFVVGSIGPTSKMLSMSTDIESSDGQGLTFDELADAFREQIVALIAGGVDALLFETIFDTLNAKAALYAAEQVMEETGKHIDIMLSFTIADAQGHTLSGQTIEQFVESVAHTDILSIGLNCGFGARNMLPHLRRLREAVNHLNKEQCREIFVSCHPNAGLPNLFGRYDETPDAMAKDMRPFVTEGLADIIGGCCGTTPDHIAKIRDMVHSTIPAPVNLDIPASQTTFEPVGERCNVAGSRKFLRLIKEKHYDEALQIAKKQVEDGAKSIDINMDDSMLDAKREMVNFIRLIGSDPELAKSRLVIDSSDFEVIEAALKCIQGKSIVNSISLKDGEQTFLKRAKTIRKLGASVIVMAFDEKGQAMTFERKIEICARAYRLLTENKIFLPQDIIFDPNILTVATGMEEHLDYANDFVRAAEWIHENLPGARVSGGLSNLSFAFRGNNYLREAMHSVFLQRAKAKGMNMAIVNVATAIEYSEIPSELRKAIEDVLFDKRTLEATETLIELANRLTNTKECAGSSAKSDSPVRTVKEVLIDALLKGSTETISENIAQALQEYKTPLAVIEGPLMDGMNQVGRLFGEGKFFLPQVVKTACAMKQAVGILMGDMEANPSTSTKKMARLIMATVKGDVHDIGKNIVGMVLTCNGYDVIDLGVMVPPERIIDEAINRNADMICLSGLITPSLEEMCTVARMMQERGLRIPLIVGGATTSPMHTAVKIAPLYDGIVVRVSDAAQNPVITAKLLNPQSRAYTEVIIRQEQDALRRRYEAEQAMSRDENNLDKRHICDWEAMEKTCPPFIGAKVHEPIAVEDVRKFVDWRYFFCVWRVKFGSISARNLQVVAEKELDRLSNSSQYDMRAITAFYPAIGTEHEIIVNESVNFTTPRQSVKASTNGECLALCDYVSPQSDYVGCFAATISQRLIDEIEMLKQGNDSYRAILLQTIGDRLVEATSEYLHREMAERYGWSGIRPAVGYPSWPDQRNIFKLAGLIDFGSIGISLTENGAMYPQSSVAGLYINNPEARYFNCR